MTEPPPDAAEVQGGPSADLEAAEAPVQAFFDQHASHYERSWDTREHGLNIGIFEVADTAREEDGLEAAYQCSRDHVVKLLERIRPLSESAHVLDVCCGTAATLAQITDRHNCRGIGIDISAVQLEHAVRLRLTNARRGHLQLRQGSASLIAEVLSGDAPFTHAFSQEGLLFADDKPAAIRGLFQLLAPEGALVISDFVVQISKQEIGSALRARVYEDVKWANGLTFQQYLQLLKEAGFELVQAELRPLDMQMTYEKLIPRTQNMAREEQAYGFLARRYAGIVRAVHDGALSWAWFAARKP